MRRGIGLLQQADDGRGLSTAKALVDERLANRDNVV